MRKYIEWIIKHRKLVIALTAIVTAGLVSQLRNLTVIIDPDKTLPQNHPNVATSLRIDTLFGSKYTVVAGVTAKEGTVFQPAILGKALRITKKIVNSKGVIKNNVVSIAARKAKNIAGNEEGLEVRPLMERVPETPEEMERLRAAIRANPVYSNLIISKDEKTLVIVADYTTGRGGFRSINETVRAIAEPEQDPSVEITFGGQPMFLTMLERYSDRMRFLLPLAVLLIGLIHFEAFRTLQGLVLPLVTALLAVFWGLGLMSSAGVPLDVFNATTPILILAIAAGHAVQILKRYYEEFHRIRAEGVLSPKEANRAAVVDSLAKIGPVMLVAGLVAALSFFSLVIFEIKTIQTFGIFTGFGILSALVLEMTFIPALRSLLKPPGIRESAREKETTVWDRISGAFGSWVAGGRRKAIYGATVVVLALLGLGIGNVVVDNRLKGYFSPNLSVNVDDDKLNDRMAGTKSLYVLVEGRQEDAIKDPKVLSAMEETQQFLEKDSLVGKTVSIVDFLKRINQSMHADRPEYYRLPETKELTAQYLLLYSTSGEPGDFDTYVDYGYQNAAIRAFLKSTGTAYATNLAEKLRSFMARRFGDEVEVKIGGQAMSEAALNEVMIKEKLLNIVQIAGVVFLLSSLLFRSFLAGALVLVPLVMTVLANFGMMGLLGIPLQISNAVTSAMAIGIGADYAIYLTYRIREEIKKGGEERQAVLRAFGSAGKAILFVASAVAGGYAVLMLSFGFKLHFWLGLLICLSMVTSALSALTVFPSLLLSLRPKFIFGSQAARIPKTVAEVTAALLLFAFLPLRQAGAQTAAPSAEEIMQKNFVATKLDDSFSDGTFRLINSKGQERVRKTIGATKLQANGIDNMRMTRFISPPDVKGTVSLLVEHSEKDDDIWIYLPALKKVRRLVSSNKKDSFVGTDFSYGDVIGHKVREWNHKIIKEETVDGQPCYVIESTPKNDDVRSNSGYSKRIGWIGKESFVTLKFEYFDESGDLLKQARFTDVRLMDPVKKRYQPMRLEAKNVQTGHTTVIQLENFKPNQGIKETYFTTRYMEKDQ
ncbi:MAG: outer membrane lipoprotein-sorting protein [candidate division Zixibacteria bacterium]|nr:outer membrane lipoprotein-sorting protein [candidate division Zixibacteria bacterium]